MVDYLVFFGLLLVGLLCYLLAAIKGETKVTYTDPFTYELNKTESPIENVLFRSLWLRNHNVVCQYPVGRYRLDMALPALKIAIECDGKAYHSSPKQKAHDRKRDAYLRSQGWKVLRFSGSMINRNCGSVVQRIENEIMKKHSIN